MSSEVPKSRLLDLPVDILYIILPYLDVPDFLALTTTCQALHNPDFSQYASYWSAVTRATFRVPNQPVVANDGARWHKMYKRLLLQSKVFTWGNNEKGCLGHSMIDQTQLNAANPALRRRMVMRSRHVSWPTEMEHLREIGIIADMQCGGWSTNLLTSRGALYSVGVLDGLEFNQRGPPFAQFGHATPTKLRYPPGFAHPNDRHEPTTAVKQFSAGRTHVLALSDSGRIWSWNNIAHAAYNVKFLGIDTKEYVTERQHGHVSKVVAGWNKSSALITGIGIVLWEPLARDPVTPEIEEDTAIVLQSATVPQTAYLRSNMDTRSSNIPSTPAGEHIGEVQNHICLEEYVLFNTHLGRVFASKIEWNANEQSLSSPFELPIELYQGPSNDGSSKQPFVTDIQGSFRSFAIFTRSGSVLIGNQDQLKTLLAIPPSAAPPLKSLPALQNTGVISLAFGDYHFHALHSDGHITSYGKEPQGCGALGLGGHNDPEGRLRGLRYEGLGGDARLVPHAYSTGRRVWFEKEKKSWITFLTSGGADPEEARERMRMCQETSVQGEISEWVEQEGRAWAERFGDAEALEFDDDGLGTYFALSVTAAGWHSGALVLVKEAEAEKLSRKCLAEHKPPPPYEAAQTEASDGRVEREGGIEADTQDNRALLDRAYGYVAEWTRWFLGAPGAITNNGQQGTAVSYRHDPSNPHAFIRPENHGAADEEGRPYAWADEPFPRLRLSDGREMPGRAEFSEWRFGRPEWDLSVQL